MRPTLLILLFLILFASCKEATTNQKEKVQNTIPETEVIQKKDTIYDNLTKDFVLGKFNYRTHSDFIKVETIHSSKTLYLNKEVYTAFVNMFEAAKNDGIDLKIISGTRNFDEQKVIWERKWKTYNSLNPNERALKILTYSSMPTTSRHHWGTDIDLNSLSNSYFSSGKGQTEYNWLAKNAETYGFYQPYTEKDHGRTGYNLEMWHWSYLPLASKYLKYYNNNIKYSDIEGFKGDSLAQSIQMIDRYVNGLSKKVKTYN